MNENDLIEAIRERLCNATDGMWCTALDDDGTNKIDVVDGGNILRVARSLTDYDAAFVSCAKQDIGYLLSCIEVLEAEIEGLRWSQ